MTSLWTFYLDEMLRTVYIKFINCMTSLWTFYLDEMLRTVYIKFINCMTSLWTFYLDEMLRTVYIKFINCMTSLWTFYLDEMLRTVYVSSYIKLYDHSLNSLAKWGSSLFEWSFTICLTPYNCTKNVLRVSLNKTFPSNGSLIPPLFPPPPLFFSCPGQRNR